jgi:hypothetical protein
MSYRVYSGPRGAEAISPLEKDRMLFKECGSLDEAMSWARHVNDGGRTPLLIEGDDGTHLTRRDRRGADAFGTAADPRRFLNAQSIGASASAASKAARASS